MTWSTKVLKFCAALEAGTGLALIVVPRFVTGLLFGEGVSGVGLVVSRLGGIGLLSLGIACWPSHIVDRSRAALWAMLTYNALVTLYLARLGIGGEWVGKLLWAVVVLHLILTVLLIRACSASQQENKYPKTQEA